MRTTTRAAAAFLTASVLAPALLLAGCGSDDSGDQPSESRTAANGDVFNDADVQFASEMLQHHAQALAMVDLTVGGEIDAEVAALAEGIRSAQAPEITTLTTWLTDWDQPIPETVRDHANAGGVGHAAGAEGPGMLSVEQMDELEAAQGADFRERWLELMIEHHEGAVAMARDQVDEGEFAPAVQLAEAIEESQSAEIERMESMLG